MKIVERLKVYKANKGIGECDFLDDVEKELIEQAQRIERLDFNLLQLMNLVDRLDENHIDIRAWKNILNFTDELKSKLNTQDT
jgi:hypothetical protein